MEIKKYGLIINLARRAIVINFKATSPVVIKAIKSHPGRPAKIRKRYSCLTSSSSRSRSLSTSATTSISISREKASRQPQHFDRLLMDPSRPRITQSENQQRQIAARIISLSRQFFVTASTLSPSLRALANVAAKTAN